MNRALTLIKFFPYFNKKRKTITTWRKLCDRKIIKWLFKTTRTERFW